MNNVMLDLETYGLGVGSVIRSVGACFFDPRTGDLGSKFYSNIDHESCLALGMKIDASTKSWWEQPSNAVAQKQLLTDQKPIVDVAADFCNWFRAQGGKYVWSQGANFDEPLWGYCIESTGRKRPWRFYDSRDTRTAYDLAGLNTRSFERAGTYHNALADAEHQAMCVHKAYVAIKGGMI